MSTVSSASDMRSHCIESQVRQSYGGDAILVCREVKPLFDMFGIQTTIEGSNSSEEIACVSDSSGIAKRLEMLAMTQPADGPGRLVDEVTFIKAFLDAFCMRWNAAYQVETDHLMG